MCPMDGRESIVEVRVVYRAETVMKVIRRREVTVNIDNILNFSIFILNLFMSQHWTKCHEESVVHQTFRNSIVLAVFLI